MVAIRRKSKPNTSPNTVSKHVVVKRLELAGRLNEALDLLELDRISKAKWDAIQVLQCNDAEAIALITNLGLDPAVILETE